MSNLNRFRRDLLIRTTTSIHGKIIYIVQDPISGQSFEFDEREYFLCKFLDGFTDLSRVATQFENRFKLSISQRMLENFVRELKSYGLIDVSERNSVINTPQGVAENWDLDPNQIFFNYALTLWSNNQPGCLLLSMGRILRPFRFGIYLLIPLSILALGILINEWSLFWQDTNLRFQYIFKIIALSPLLFILNFFTQTLLAVVAASWGAKIRYLKILLLFGVLPYFIVDRAGIWFLTRQGRLWSFSTPALVRLFFLISGIFLWYENRVYGTGLSTLSLSLIYLNVMSLMLEVNPLWVFHSSGFCWLVTYFKIDFEIQARSRQLWQRIIRRQPIPRSLSNSNITFLLGYGVIVTVLNLVIFTSLSIFVAVILESNFQGTGVIIFLVCLSIFIYFIYRTMSRNKERRSRTLNSPAAAEDSNLIVPVEIPDLSIGYKIGRFFRQHWPTMLILGGIVGVLFIPYPYSVGGEIRLISWQRQEIQANAEGKVIEVPLNGGDSQWIKAGTVIAVLESPDLENSLLTTRERIKAQTATVDGQRANLTQLVSTPRQEEVDVQKAALRDSQSQLEVEKRSLDVKIKELHSSVVTLETAKTDRYFRKQEELRLKEMYDEGVITLQLYEDSQRLASLAEDRVNEQTANIQVVEQQIEEQRQNVRSAQDKVEQEQAKLNLLLSGPHPDEIKKARQDVERAEAELKRLQQELKYLTQQNNRQILKMPFDGTLSTGDLKAKLGAYLGKSDTFAIAENNRALLGVMEVPEVQVDEIAKSNQVQIRLLGYPSRDFTGTVKSIDPTAKTTQMSGQTATNQKSGETTQYTPDEAGQFVNIIVEVNNPDNLLISGMTGYAKIRGNTMPVILAFSRPLVRFFQIEIWSWFP